MGGFEASGAEIDNYIENIRLSTKSYLQLAKMGHPLCINGQRLTIKERQT